MAIFNPVMGVVTEMLNVPNFVQGPFLGLGVQDIEKSDIEGVIPPEFKFDTLGQLLRARGIEVDELDPFDSRAKLQFNLNEPVPEEFNEAYATLLDYGCSEHIFDTRQVLENCMRMVMIGGFYAVHAPCRNFANHGLHTYHSELLPRAMEANGFEIVFLKYTTDTGREVDVNGNESIDTICWVVGRKLKTFKKFVCPEQSRYEPK